MLNEKWVNEFMWPDTSWQDVIAFYSIANNIGAELDKLDTLIFNCRSQLHPLIQLELILESPDLWLTRNRFQE